MAQQHTFERLAGGTFALEGLVLGSGTRILHGTAAPTSGVTGKGRAAKGSLYIQTVAGNPALYENAGTKLDPVWQQLVGGLQ
jgi:hypothetical protein